MAKVVVVHERADPDAVGEGGHRGEVRHRGRLAHEVVRQDERGDAQVLRGARPLAELASTRHVQRIGKEREGRRHVEDHAGHRDGPTAQGDRRAGRA